MIKSTTPSEPELSKTFNTVLAEANISAPIANDFAASIKLSIPPELISVKSYSFFNAAISRTQKEVLKPHSLK